MGAALTATDTDEEEQLKLPVIAVSVLAELLPSVQPLAKFQGASVGAIGAEVDLMDDRHEVAEAEMEDAEDGLETKAIGEAKDGGTDETAEPKVVLANVEG